MSDFARILKTFRKEAGLTQTELAAAIGTRQASIVRWEKGGEPRAEAFIRLRNFAWSKGYDIESPWDSSLSGLRLTGEVEAAGRIRHLPQDPDQPDELVEYGSATFRDCDAIVIRGDNFKPRLDAGDLLVFGARSTSSVVPSVARYLLVALQERGIYLQDTQLASTTIPTTWFDAEAGRSIKVEWVASLVAIIPAGCWGVTPRGTFKRLQTVGMDQPYHPTRPPRKISKTE